MSNTDRSPLDDLRKAIDAYSDAADALHVRDTVESAVLFLLGIVLGVLLTL